VSAVFSDDESARRRWGAGDLVSSCYRALAGAERGFRRCPPGNDGSSEKRDFALASAPAWGFPPVIRQWRSLLRWTPSHRSCGSQ